LTAFASHRLLALVALGVLAAVPLAPLSAAAETASQREVLDLDEAAALLRVRPEVIRDLAEAQRVPARLLGDAWRFSRVALLEWLKAGQVGTTAAAAPVRPGHLNPAQALTGELSTLSARGTAPEVPTRMAQAAPEARPDAGAAPLPTVGERPSAPTAEDVALRDQRVLLKRGVLTADFGMSYSYSEQTFFPFIRQERRQLGVNTALRYGLLNDLQASLRMPGVSSRSKTFTLGAGGGAVTQSVASDHYVGDASLSLRGVALREAVGRPNLIWNVDAMLPTGPGDRGVGGGLVLSKSYDPAVIFAGLSYLRGLALDASDPRRSLPRHSLGLSMGYTYAVNDALALSSVFAGSYRNTPAPVEGTLPPARERYQLQLGLTWLLTRGLFMEPAVTMRLGGESPDLNVSLNLAYTF